MDSKPTRGGSIPSSGANLEGIVGEWFNPASWKGADLTRSVSSNLTDSASKGYIMVAPWLMILMAVIQLGVAIDLFRTHHYGMGVAFFAYAVSTIGLMYATEV